MLDAMLKKSDCITSVKREGQVLYLKSESGILRIWPKSDVIVRVSFTCNECFSKTQGVEYDLYDEKCTWTLKENSNEIILETARITLNVNRQTGSITYLNTNGQTILKERDKESKILDSFEVYKVVFDEETQVNSVETADGVKKTIGQANRCLDRTLYHTQLHLEFDEKEAIYGLGQHDEGVFNYRGTTQYLHQANKKIAIPMLVSSKGYGILLTTQGAAVFHDTSEGTFLATESDDMIDYYFMAGVNLDEVVDGFRKITGRAVMLPKWAFGYIQSVERYESQQEIEETVERFRENHIGIDAIVLDWMSWDDGMWGQKTRDEKRFPDVSTMMDRLHDTNVHFMVSIWPNMTEITSDYAEMKAAGHLLPANTTYNAYDADARKLYWKQAYDGWFQYGIDGWWCDSSEAFTPEWNHVCKPQDFVMYREFVDESSNFMPIDRINAYGLYHAQGIYEGQRDISNEKRVLNLTRSGYPGSQKYGTILWSGDTSANWNTLQQQIVAGLNFCVTGMPYWTLDIGAFFVKKGFQWYWDGSYPKANEDLGYCELYTRWYQYGALLPMFRSHGTDCRREPWAFGNPGEMFYDAILKANRLRYKLMPYIYSLAGSTWRENATMLRLLAFDFPEDENVLNIANQYMFGPSILVCPVTKPIYYDIDSTPLIHRDNEERIYLPAGCKWYDFYSGKEYEGGMWINISLSMDRIPLFVKAGAIIPMIEAVESTKECAQQEISLHIYKGADGKFDLYEDEGDGYGYEEGEYCITQITYSEASGKVDMISVGEEKYKTKKITYIIEG